MPSPMSGRGKELFGYKISDAALFYSALAIFGAATLYVSRTRLGGVKASTLSRAQAARLMRQQQRQQSKH